MRDTPQIRPIEQVDRPTFSGFGQECGCTTRGETRRSSHHGADVHNDLPVDRVGLCLGLAFCLYAIGGPNGGGLAGKGSVVDFAGHLNRRLRLRVGTIKRVNFRDVFLLIPPPGLRSVGGLFVSSVGLLAGIEGFGANAIGRLDCFFCLGYASGLWEGCCRGDHDVGSSGFNLVEDAVQPNAGRLGGQPSNTSDLGDFIAVGVEPDQVGFFERKSAMRRCVASFGRSMYAMTASSSVRFSNRAVASSLSSCRI